MDWNAALSSLATALTVTKAIKDIDAAYDKAVYKGQIAELLNSLAEVKLSVVEARDELREKDAEISRLKDSLAAKESLVEGPGGYRWIDKGEGLKLGYPICPTCDEKEGRQVILKQSGGSHSTVCPRCATVHSPVEYFHEPDVTGVQKTESQAARERRDAANARNSAAIRRAGNYLG